MKCNNKIIFEESNNNVIYYIRDEEGSLIGIKYNNEIYYYIKNLQEDIIGITDSNYNILCRYEYDSWGKIITIKDNNGNIIEDESHIGIINPFRYRSYYYDKETKLYYLNSRYYNPEWGRFINVDEGIVPNDVIGLNMYVYANNNPINFGDEDGNKAKWWTKAVKKVLIGAAVIGACAIAVAVTGGAAAGVAGYIASGMLKGAVIGSVTTAVTSAGIAAVSSRVKTGSWKESGKAAVNGAANGFATGAVTGAAAGFASSVSKAKNAVGHWDKGNFNSSYDSMNYHYSTHGSEIPRNNIVNYTNDAMNFANRNSNSLNFTYNYNYNNTSWNLSYNPGMGGQFTGDGHILTFWYKKMK